MSTQMHLSASSLEPIVNHIFQSRCITRSDQQRFMAIALSQDSLGQNEKMLVDRVFEALRKGLLRVVD